MLALLHVKMGRMDKSEKLPPLNVELQSRRVVPHPQLMVVCPLFDAHPPLLGCVPLNTCDLMVLYDNTGSGIESVQTYNGFR